MRVVAIALVALLAGCSTGEGDVGTPTATARCATIGPVSTPASTTKSVQPVIFTPCSSASAGARIPGKWPARHRGSDTKSLHFQLLNI